MCTWPENAICRIGRSRRIGARIFRSLSWAGYDFVDSIRPPDVWAQTKDAATKVGGFTVDILVAAANAYVQKKLADFLGGPH
ncbi:TPA: DUF2513 domain-containing protein [Burkholderia cenocepacia]